MKRFVAPWVAIIATVAISQSAASADLAAGASLAQSICAACHDISSTKPRREQPRMPEVPPAFYTVAQNRSHTAEWFARFLRMPHGRMDNVTLTQSDIDNVSAYILAMRNP